MDIAVRRPTAVRTPTRDAERLAVGTTAAAVAMLPLLVPRGPANLGPADVVMAMSIASCFFWAATTGRRWSFVYGMPMALFIAAGALGALAGPVPNAGIVAILQDVFLLAWCWSVANIARSSERVRVLVSIWAYSAIAWATLLFVGLALGAMLPALAFAGPITTRELPSAREQTTAQRPVHRKVVFYALSSASAIPKPLSWIYPGYPTTAVPMEVYGRRDVISR